MAIIDKLFAAPQYSLANREKCALLVEELLYLNEHHTNRCAHYQRIAAVTSRITGGAGEGVAALPFLPARLFKELQLQSIPSESVYKILMSSGTTQQQPSRIVLDRETSQLQTKALAAIVTSCIGRQRRPMVIIDSRSVLHDRQSLSARAAGLVGLSTFGRDHYFALDEQMRLDVSGLKAYLDKHAGERLLIFGFTYMVWKYFYAELKRLGETLCLDDAILLHSGGWKKLQEEAVSNDQFRDALSRQCGIRQVYNFYGMVEQVGSIYMECDKGYLHAPNFADLLIRDQHTWQVLPQGESGIIETCSVLPRSYPGHVLLTEDLGIIHGVDNCPCGRLGTYFSVLGRVARSELRGCSDTHAYQVPAGSDKAGATLVRLAPAPVEMLSPESPCSNDFFSTQPLIPFADEQVAFLDELSRGIFGIPEVRRLPELAALAYWLRKSHVTAMIATFTGKLAAGEFIKPRGVVFHVAPANVETIYLYSWALSLLVGNLNVVRVSAINSEPSERLLELIRVTLAKSEWGTLATRNLLISYPHDDRVSSFFSSRADVRMIWGGDATVRKIRSLAALPTVKDVVFADKVSAALIHAHRYLHATEDEASTIARLFCNDAYQFDQLACSSPRIVWFVGTSSHSAEASRRFWDRLAGELARRGHRDQTAVAMDKLVQSCRDVANGGALPSVGAFRAGWPTVVQLAPGEVSTEQAYCGGGYFYECFIENLEELAAHVKVKDQTLSYTGFTPGELRAVAGSLCRQGIARIVPFGQSLSFAPVWDGYDLFGELTMRMTIQ